MRVAWINNLSVFFFLLEENFFAGKMSQVCDIYGQVLLVGIAIDDFFYYS